MMNILQELLLSEARCLQLFFNVRDFTCSSIEFDASKIIHIED